MRHERRFFWIAFYIFGQRNIIEKLTFGIEYQKGGAWFGVSRNF